MTASDPIARVVVSATDALGGSPTITRHDLAGDSPLGVIRSVGSPEPGMASCATVGFCANDMGLRAEGRSLRVELLLCGHSEQDGLDRILAATARALVRSGVACGHAKIVPDLVPAEYSRHGLRHALFTVPFLWDGPEVVTLDGLLVAWLLIVPLADGERRFAAEHGVDALEDLFRRDEVNVFDLRRPAAA